MEARAEAESVLFADLHQPHRTLAQNFGVGALGHQNHALGIGAKLRHQVLDLPQIVLLHDNELELVFVTGHEALQNRGLDAQTVVGRRPPAALAFDGS